MRLRVLGALVAMGASHAGAQSVERTLTVAERVRTYHLHVPSKRSSPAALVFVFHGGGGQGSGIERTSGFDAISEREGFVVVYPDGVDRGWNDGRTDAPRQGALRKQVDDLAFVRAMLTDIATVVPVDSKRIYATGMSNGAIFSQYLAAKMSDRFAAIAPVAGGIADPFNQEFAPANPVSVLAINGTRDPLVPYAGGNVARVGRGKVISVDDAMHLWVVRDGASPEAQTGLLPDTDPSDGCRVTWKKWTGGKNGTEVWLYSEEGAGHTWPGKTQNLPRVIVGSVCRDFEGSEVIWAFFKSHPKP
ncbi:MAG TPA: PHB depolymerase family esterase [Gemmatimonadaceae bacterium]|nr:PHB depolymerase family esterase [Gemmatimonadaceae bacterium]